MAEDNRRKSFCGELDNVVTEATDKIQLYEGGSTHTYQNEYDESMYTDFMQKKRQAMRDDPKINEFLDKFWEALPDQDVQAGHVSRQDYIDYEIKLCKALFHPEDWCMRDAKEAAEEDWGRENGSEESMPTKSFEDSLYETVDIWTTSADLGEYRFFLGKLYERMTLNGKFRKLQDIKSIASQTCNEPKDMDKAARVLA